MTGSVTEMFYREASVVLLTNLLIPVGGLA